MGVFMMAVLSRYFQAEAVAAANSAKVTVAGDVADVAVRAGAVAAGHGGGEGAQDVRVLGGHPGVDHGRDPLLAVGVPVADGPADRLRDEPGRLGHREGLRPGRGVGAPGVPPGVG
jgi:hypothetical protein